MATTEADGETDDDGSSDFLALSCSEYDEWNRQLTVEARSGGFAGLSSAYFGVDRLRTFAAGLGEYPLGSERPQLSSGFGGVDEITQEHVGLVVEQIGSNGQIGIAVHLATPDWGEARPAPLHDVRLELLTTYERLRTFGLDLADVVQGHLDRAVIGGERLR